MAAPTQECSQLVCGKRKGKAQFLPAKRARRGDAGGPRQLEPGLQGILISCNMNEHKCVEEAYSLLNEYGDDMYGPEKFVDKEQQPSGSEGVDDDVEAALKTEVGDIKASTEMRLRRFQTMESGANNVVFIRTLGIEPEKLVHHILQDMYKTKKKKTRVILRMLPISGTCKPFLEDMKKKYNLQEVVKSAKDSQPHPKLGNGKEAKLEPDGKLNQSEPSEGKNNQQVAPESIEVLEQRKQRSKTQVESGEAKPELESQVSEGPKPNENAFS
ncbi:THUMP domain-containing protein 1 [Sigmodon hispidus]